MNKVIELRDKTGRDIEATLKELDLSYIDKIMEFQDIIYAGLEDKQLYSPSDKEEFVECITKKGKVIGVVTKENFLVAMGVYIKNGYDESNYGYDLGLEAEELMNVGQIECTLVREEFRGNRLQKVICEALEEIGRSEKTFIMTATASPYNEFSVNTFKKLGYEIKKDKIKYGGLRRYVFEKRLDKTRV